jgi:ABC-type amino acid transport substrate-binding protein
LQGEPFLMNNTTPENPNLQGNDRYKGYSMDLLKEIAEILKIEFEFRLVPSNKHDDLVNELVARVRSQLPPCCHCVHVAVITC